MSNHSFVNKSFRNPGDYAPRTDAPPLVGGSDTNVRRYNLLETGAPEHTRNYMRGLDVIGWRNPDGVERSHLIIDQKAGALVLPWEASSQNGVWLFLQETYRAPHSKDADISVKQQIGRGALDRLGIWSLEAPAGGLKHDADGNPIEEPVVAAVRELGEETGLVFDEGDLVDLLPGGLHVGSDINTKVSHLFTGDVAKGSHDPARRAIEADEAVGQLLAFKVNDRTDVAKVTELTRRHSDTTTALALAALHPDISKRLAG